MSPLDKENAHFYIAEAIIQAIEHLHCTGGRRGASRKSRTEVTCTIFNLIREP